MFNPVVNPFSKYADKTEKKVDKLLKGTAFKGGAEIRTKLLNLMQYNLVAVNLWLEKRFKGYKYLTKGTRKRFYRNTAFIIAEFSKHIENLQINKDKLDNLLSNHGFNASAPDKKERIKHIYSIMDFLQPGKYYTYLEGASFGKLLADIDREKMIGDCNQIVTFYVFLYSQKYPIQDLQIKILPGHVCLHFEGIDIEATSATFHTYETYEKILPIIELITTNLLDTSDFRDKQLKIDSRSYIKAAELAYKITNNNEVVEKNLQVAYHNLAVESAAKHDFATAKFFAAKLNDPKLQQNIFKNAVIFYTNSKRYKKAKYYASFTNDPGLGNYIRNQEGWFYFKKKDFDKALKFFQSTGDQKMVKACYGEKYNRIQKKVSNIKTAAGHRSHMNDYRKMIELAGKMGDNELQSRLRKFLHSIK